MPGSLGKQASRRQLPVLSLLFFLFKSRSERLKSGLDLGSAGSNPARDKTYCFQVDDVFRYQKSVRVLTRDGRWGAGSSVTEMVVVDWYRCTAYYRFTFLIVISHSGAKIVS